MKIRTTLEGFKVATYVGDNPKQRGPKIMRIDNLLREYWQMFDQLPLRNQIAITASLFTECKEWLKTKSTKSDYKRKLFGPEKVNETLQRRRRAITALAEECLDALDALEGELNPENRLRRRFDRKKVQALGSGLNRLGSKTLSTGYQFERTMWLKTDKKRAYGGGGVGAKVDQPQVQTQLRRVRGKRKLEELSYTEYEQIGDLCKVGTVQYLKKHERLEHLVEVDDEGRLCHATDGSLLDAENQEGVPHNRDEALEALSGFKIRPTHLHMYAMDSYGNLFARWIPDSRQMRELGYVFFNHSSLNSGREITCAGMLVVVGGRLLAIDNFSGHYKPTRQNLLNCVKMLAADGVDLRETVVDVFERAWHYYFSVDHFLQLGTQPDLGTVKSGDW